jgi:hypothetical protein
MDHSEQRHRNNEDGPKAPITLRQAKGHHRTTQRPEQQCGDCKKDYVQDYGEKIVEELLLILMQ